MSQLSNASSSNAPVDDAMATNRPLQYPPILSVKSNLPPYQYPPCSLIRHARGDLRTSSLSAATASTPPATPDNELLSQLSSEELISRIKNLEAKNRKLLYDNGSMTKDINHHLSTLQQIKHQNYQLLSDNNELRDLCCYLDDERVKSRSIAQEWQSFGTYMRQEVTNYSSKVSKLESMQSELLKENFELKQICLLLDNAINVRENGDGSTSSSPNEDPSSLTTPPYRPTMTNQTTTPSNLTNNYRNTQQQQHRMILCQQILEYRRALENRIQQLEFERKKWTEVPSNVDTIDSFENNSVSTSDHNPSQASVATCPSSNTSGCPPSILKAMQVLKIHESLNIEPDQNGCSHPLSSSEEQDERPTDQQKAIVQGLCNVVWRKIEDGS